MTSQKVSKFIPNYDEYPDMDIQKDKYGTVASLTEEAVAKPSEPKGFWRRAWEMYRDGFKNMSKTSRQLWLLVLIKLFIMFAILRAFLFPNFLNQNTDGSEDGKSDYVTEQFVNRALK